MEKFIKCGKYLRFQLYQSLAIFYVSSTLVAYAQGVKSGEDYEIEDYLQNKLADYPVVYIKSNGYQPVVVMELDSSDSDLIRVVDNIRNDEIIDFGFFKKYICG